MGTLLGTKSSAPGTVRVAFRFVSRCLVSVRFADPQAATPGPAHTRGGDGGMPSRAQPAETLGSEKSTTGRRER